MLRFRQKNLRPAGVLLYPRIIRTYSFTRLPILRLFAVLKFPAGFRQGYIQ